MVDSLRTGTESPQNSRNNMNRRMTHGYEMIQTDYVCLVANNPNGTYNVVVKRAGVREPLMQDTTHRRDQARLTGVRYFTNLIGLTQPEQLRAESGIRR